MEVDKVFDALSNRLTEVFDKLKKRGALSEADVDAALRDIRIALLEADVALPVVKEFIEVPLTVVKSRQTWESLLSSPALGNRERDIQEKIHLFIRLAHPRQLTESLAFWGKGGVLVL